MHRLGVRTTRALAAVATGETVFREGVEPGGVLTGVALSHIRVGTFEYFAARHDVAGAATASKSSTAALSGDADRRAVDAGGASSVKLALVQKAGQVSKEQVVRHAPKTRLAVR
jgi:hypothetical protein